eukprot:TRINITY_DN5680_c0_g1_i1.p1 TRINITY_DN5680_c0_g1~~TRINITY_DN5680_c0_g1_i1.p1  ORF type:complete len:121 (-),score=37.63 TRINITY_DN5680_c0_g1_i1:77-439(-)
MMLKPKVLPKILQQAKTQGVKSAILVTMEGDLLASSGGDPNDKLVGAIVLNIWASYQKISPSVSVLLVECEEGKVAIAQSSNFLICLQAEQSACFGSLKTKVEKLKEHFEDPLSKLEIKQ